MASKKTVLEGLYMLRELIPNWDISQQTAKVWELALKDLNDEQVTFAFEAYLTHSTSDYNRIPRPGDLRKLVQTAQGMTWDQAFEEITGKAYYCLNPVWHGGKFQEVQWSTPQVRAAMYRMGGPEFFASLQSSGVNTAKAQFRQVWENMEQRASLDSTLQLASGQDRKLIANEKTGQTLDVSALVEKMGMN